MIIFIYIALAKHLAQIHKKFQIQKKVKYTD